MILSTTDSVPGKVVKEIKGIVKGNIIKTKHIGKDILSALKTLVGGELKSYTKLITEAREEAIRRMIKEAEKLNADAIINIRFTTNSVMQGAAEILVYGTAVVLK